MQKALIKIPVLPLRDPTLPLHKVGRGIILPSQCGIREPFLKADEKIDHTSDEDTKRYFNVFLPVTWLQLVDLETA